MWAKDVCYCQPSVVLMYPPARLSFTSPPPTSPRLGLLGALGRHCAYLRQLHHVCEQAPHLPGPELVAALLACLAIRVEHDPAELRRLPAPGAFLAVANQPGSLLTSLVVLHVLGQARPELRALVEQELAPLLPQLTAHCVRPGAAAGPGGPSLRRLLRLLHNDVPLVVFPDQSATHFPAVAERLLTTLRRPLGALWLHTQPAPTTWWRVLPLLLRRPMGLPGELLALRGTTVQVRLGAAVAAQVLHGLPAAARLPYLRARLEALGTGPAAPDPVPAPPCPH